MNNFGLQKNKLHSLSISNFFDVFQLNQHISIFTRQLKSQFLIFQLFVVLIRSITETYDFVWDIVHFVGVFLYFHFFNFSGRCFCRRNWNSSSIQTRILTKFGNSGRKSTWLLLEILLLIKIFWEDLKSLKISPNFFWADFFRKSWWPSQNI